MDSDLDYDTKSLMEARVILSKMSKVMLASWMAAGCPESWMPVLKEYEDYVAKVRENGR